MKAASASAYAPPSKKTIRWNLGNVLQPATQRSAATGEETAALLGPFASQQSGARAPVGCVPRLPRANLPGFELRLPLGPARGAYAPVPLGAVDGAGAGAIGVVGQSGSNKGAGTGAVDDAAAPRRDRSGIVCKASLCALLVLIVAGLMLLAFLSSHPQAQPQPPAPPEPPPYPRRRRPNRRRRRRGCRRRRPPTLPAAAAAARATAAAAVAVS